MQQPARFFLTVWLVIFCALIVVLLSDNISFSTKYHRNQDRIDFDLKRCRTCEMADPKEYNSPEDVPYYDNGGPVIYVDDTGYASPFPDNSDPNQQQEDDEDE